MQTQSFFFFFKGLNLILHSLSKIKVNFLNKKELRSLIYKFKLTVAGPVGPVSFHDCQTFSCNLTSETSLLKTAS